MKLFDRIARGCLITFAAFAFAACSSSDPEPVPEPTPEPNPGGEVVDPDAPVNGTMTEGLIQGFVTDTEGNPLAGVQVVSGTHSTVTDAAGSFIFSRIDVNDGRSIVTFTKSGYFKVVRSNWFADEENWNVAMCAKNQQGFSTESSFSSSEQVTLRVGKMSNELPQNGFKNRASGEAYTGKVKADMVYLDPNAEYFAEMMPGGDLAAVNSDNEPVQLVSYGMTAVNLTDESGNSLQIKDGSEATLKFPIPEGMEENAPETIPLWSFNESTGLWEQEGDAVLKGDYYEGTVKHFSWVNLDYPEKEATVQGSVTDEHGTPLPNICVKVGQVTARTDARGFYKHQVPANTAFRVMVEPRYYGYYPNPVVVDVERLPAQSVKTVDLVLPVLNKVTGRLIDGDGKPGNGVLWISYDGKKSELCRPAADGRFSVLQPGSYNGPALLHVLCDDGREIIIDFNLTDKDIDLGDIKLGGGGNTPDPGVMTSEEAKLYIEETARMFLGKFNPDDHQQLLSLLGYAVDAYDSFDAPYEWGIDEIDDEDWQARHNMPRRFFTSLYSAMSRGDYAGMSHAANLVFDFERFAGVFEPGSDRWLKVDSSKDIVFRFSHNGQVCELRATGSGKEWDVTEGNASATVPSKVILTLKEGNAILADATVITDFNQKGHTLTADIKIKAANAEVTTNLNGNDSKVTSVTSVSINGAAITSVEANMVGKRLCDMSVIEELFEKVSDEWGTYYEFNPYKLSELIKTGSCNGDILGRIHLKADVSDFGAILDVSDDDFDKYGFSSKEEARKACQHQADVINVNMPVKLFLAGASASQVDMVWKPVLYEDEYWWEWYNDPMLKFADGTTYSFVDYFEGSNLEGVQSQLGNLIDTYISIWENH